MNSLCSARDKVINMGEADGPRQVPPSYLGFPNLPSTAYNVQVYKATNHKEYSDGEVTDYLYSTRNSSNGSVFPTATMRTPKTLQTPYIWQRVKTAPCHGPRSADRALLVEALDPCWGPPPTIIVCRRIK